jgi:hypothetical protein
MSIFNRNKNNTVKVEKCHDCRGTGLGFWWVTYENGNKGTVRGICGTCRGTGVSGTDAFEKLTWSQIYKFVCVCGGAKTSLFGEEIKKSLNNKTPEEIDKIIATIINMGESIVGSMKYKVIFGGSEADKEGILGLLLKAVQEEEPVETL